MKRILKESTIDWFEIGYKKIRPLFSDCTGDTSIFPWEEGLSREGGLLGKENKNHDDLVTLKDSIAHAGAWPPDFCKEEQQTIRKKNPKMYKLFTAHIDEYREALAGWKKYWDERTKKNDAQYKKSVNKQTNIKEHGAGVYKYKTLGYEKPEVGTVSKATTKSVKADSTLEAFKKIWIKECGLPDEGDDEMFDPRNSSLKQLAQAMINLDDGGGDGIMFIKNPQGEIIFGSNSKNESYIV